MSIEELAQHELETLLYSRAVRLLRCPPDAWDLVQDTFEHALRGYGSFQHGSNMRVWLMTIMQHLFIDRCRKRAREPWVEPIDDDIVATVEPEVNSKPEWATISDEQEQSRAVDVSWYHLRVLAARNRRVHLGPFPLFGCPV